MSKEENNVYTIPCKSGVLQEKYFLEPISLCPQILLTENNVNLTDEISLRKAVHESSPLLQWARVYKVQLHSAWQAMSYQKVQMFQDEAEV